MRILLIAVLSLAASHAMACETYTSELHEPGGKTVTVENGALTLAELGEAPTTIEHGSVGTGITTRYGTAQKYPERTFSILFTSDDGGDMIVIDMEVFRPHCPT